MKSPAVVLLTALITAVPAAGQSSVGGIRANAFPRIVTVSELGPADGTQGLRIVTDDADCNPATADDGVVLCLDDGSWSLVTDGGGGADTTCLDAGVACLFAGSTSEGGAATSALDLSCTGCVAASEVAADVATQAELNALDIAADDLSDNAVTDLSDVTAVSGNTTTLATTSGTLTSGNCVEIDASGNLVDAGAACGGGGGSSGFADLTSGTNTTAAMVVGAGSSLKIAGTGTIDASGIDADGDGTRELTCTPGSSTCSINPAENTIAIRFENFGGGAPWLRLDDGSNTAGIRYYSGLARATTGATEVWAWGSGAMVSMDAGGFRLDFGAPSATSPGYMPNQADPDTGVCWGGDNDYRVCSGGSSGLGVTTTAVTNFRTILKAAEPQVTAPATCTIGELYVDTSGAWCGCEATNAWGQLNAVGTCS